MRSIDIKEEELVSLLKLSPNLRTIRVNNAFNQQFLPQSEQVFGLEVRDLKASKFFKQIKKITIDLNCNRLDLMSM